jgi:hypothetical protein
LKRFGDYIQEAWDANKHPRNLKGSSQKDLKGKHTGGRFSKKPVVATNNNTNTNSNVNDKYKDKYPSNLLVTGKPIDEWEPDEQQDIKQSLSYCSRHPNMSKEKLRVIRLATRAYNCIAAAFGVEEQWWWPGGPGWPIAVNHGETVKSFDALVKHFGGERCNGPEIEEGYVKLDLYIDQYGEPTHMARQTIRGTWISKMGGNMEVEHDLNELDGEGYGEPRIFYRFPIDTYAKMVKNNRLKYKKKVGLW